MRMQCIQNTLACCVLRRDRVPRIFKLGFLLLGPTLFLFFSPALGTLLLLYCCGAAWVVGGDCAPASRAAAAAGSAPAAVPVLVIEQVRDLSSSD